MEAKASEVVELKDRLMKVIEGYAFCARESWDMKAEDDFNEFSNSILDTIAEYVVETRN